MTEQEWDPIQREAIVVGRRGQVSIFGVPAAPNPRQTQEAPADQESLPPEPQDAQGLDPLSPATLLGRCVLLWGEQREDAVIVVLSIEVEVVAQNAFAHEPQLLEKAQRAFIRCVDQRIHAM